MLLYLIRTRDADGVVELDSDRRSEDQLLTFSLAGGQAVETSYITVNDANDVQVGAKISGVAGIPDGGL